MVLGDKTPEGDIIEAVALSWIQIVNLLKTNPRAVHEIDWRKWEEMLAGAYKAAGFDEVELTSRSGDHGRDLIATKNGRFSIRIIDQMKAYAPGNLVAANDVRAMSGVLNGDPNVSKGYVTTTSGFAPGIFTDPLIKPLMPYRLELRDGPSLINWLTEIANRKA